MLRTIFARRITSGLAVMAAALAVAAAPASAAVMTASTRTADTAAATSSGKTQPFGRIDCLYGQLCIFHNGGYVTYVKCQRVYLSYWTDSGAFMNNQTTGTITRFYDVHGNEITSMRSKAFNQQTTDWDPVWSIQVC